MIGKVAILMTAEMSSFSGRLINEAVSLTTPMAMNAVFQR